jgi:hypothetical protein
MEEWSVTREGGDSGTGFAGFLYHHVFNARRHTARE